MSRKRGRTTEDPLADDPEDETYGSRISPRKKVKKSTSSRPKPKRRSGYGRGDEDVDDDEDEFSDEESIEEVSEEEASPVMRTQTGRPARRSAAKTQYQDPDSDEEIEAKDEIENSEEERRHRRRAPSAKPSLTVTLKLPKPRVTSRSSTTRTASKSVKPLEPLGTRRSSRISHDESDALVSLTNSGKHEKVERTSSATPEPSAKRPIRAAKRLPTTSAIIEASFEDSQERQDAGLTQHSMFTQGQQDSQQGEDEAPIAKNVDMAGPVIAESVHEEEDEDDEDPVQRINRRRSQRLSQHAHVPVAPATRRSGRTRRGGLEEKDTSDFEPGADEPEDDVLSQSEDSKSPRKQSQRSEASSQQGRRSGRLAKKRTSQRVASGEESELELDQDELAEEAAELKASRRGGRRRRRTSLDITYDQPRLREREKKDYRVFRPELLLPNDEEDGPSQTAASQRRGRGGAGAYRSLFSTQGPFGGAGTVPTGSGGAAAVGGADSDSSDDELARQAARAVGGVLGMTPTTAVSNNPFPQNLNSDAILGGMSGAMTAVGKVKDKKLLADADPLGVDQNVNFDGVGGLGDHINQLKEMVMLPLLYPEIFQRMHITPPRGVLFHGPPGTGKTLLARALASSVSSQGKKVTFYMRKGADALSKWVGEAERQLRLLFEEARKTQPSIIFFDEIDGLAPVRSSRQEQIHASIVATLLALMDGMDGRGQVIVIGATNRPDSVDPALRRPGRFDREFYFPLPNQVARRSIIDIHTKGWEPELEPKFKDQLAALTKGYGGADLRALCTEAALNAVQGTYPQIYKSNQKLIIDPSTIKVLAKDFMVSVNKMIPSSERSAPSGAAPLEPSVEPLLRDALAKVSALLDDILPENKILSALEEAEYGDRDDIGSGFEREIMQQRFNRARVFRPRLLVYGPQGMGQQYVGAAILNKYERLHVQSLDLSILYSESGRSAEAAVVQLFNEARRHKPSVIYIPNVDVWYNTVGESVVRLLTGLLRTLPPNEPVLVLGIMEFDAGEDREHQKLDPSLLKDLFGFSGSTHVKLDLPNRAQRFEYFQNVVSLIEMPPTEFPDLENRKKRELPVLPVALAIEAPPKPLTKTELKAQKKNDRMTLNYLKIKLSPIMDQLKRAYKKFVRAPVDRDNFEYLFDEQDHTMVSTDLPIEEIQGQYRPYEMSKDEKGIPGIREVATGKFFYNLELITIEQRFVNGYYKRPKDFLADIKRLVKDARTLGDADRIIKANQMLTNVETDVDMLERTEIALVAECEKVYARELERESNAVEHARQAEREGRDVPVLMSNVPPPEDSHTTTEASGPIVLGALVPSRPSVPIPQFLRSPVSNGYYHGSDPSHNSDLQRIGYDTEMSNSAELPQLPAGSDPDGSRLNLGARRVQKTAMTHMAHDSQPVDYYNSASTTTSGKKSDDKSQQHRSSGHTSNGLLSNNTQSSNGTGKTAHPEFPSTQQYSGTPLPDTQEQHYLSGSSQSQLSSQVSQPSQQQHPRSAPATAGASLGPINTNTPAMGPPAPSSIPRQHSLSVSNLLNNPPSPTSQRPNLILDKTWLSQFQNELVDASSGFSVEQLEQMMAAVMGAVWRGRMEWNRMRLAEKVKEVFNSTVADIEAMQKVAKASQETGSGEGDTSLEGNQGGGGGVGLGLRTGAGKVKGVRMR